MQNNSSKKYLVVVAGGHGTRMGAAIPKQFLDLCGRSILQRTIEKFVYAVPDIKVVTVLPKEYMDVWKNSCLRDSFIYPQQLVEGGLTRYHSVKNALEKIPDGAIVAIHDAVRPMITPDLIARMYSRMAEVHALIPVVPSFDTLCSLDQDKDGTLHTSSIPAPDRSTTFAVQTPQMFRSEEIKEAYKLPYNLSFTDDASVARAAGIPLSYIRGERMNIKITTEDDLEFARMVASSWEE